MRSAQRYTAHLRPMNFVALAANASFIGLHLLQGRYSFDGLSQDLPFWSSQAPPLLCLPHRKVLMIRGGSCAGHGVSD